MLTFYNSTTLPNPRKMLKILVEIWQILTKKCHFYEKKTNY